MSRTLLYLLVTFLVCEARSLSKLQPCHRTDPNLNNCLQSAIQSALQNDMGYDIPPLDVLTVPAYIVKATESLSFDHTETDIRIGGHLSSEIKDVDAKIGESDFSLSFNVFIKNASYEANYDYKGAIFDGVDMSGKGRKVFLGDNFRFTSTFNGVVNQNGDYRYLKITDVSLNGPIIEMAHFTFESEDGKSGELLTKLMNQNWKSILRGETKKYMTIYEEAYKKGANTVFSKIPYDILFPK
ncbi:uncharacterized protein LOC116181170 [Photinus pyralis]|nr:uncharacterized protein LOC116181170 [Photinus pyralis]